MLNNIFYCLTLFFYCLTIFFVNSIVTHKVFTVLLNFQRSFSSQYFHIAN